MTATLHDLRLRRQLEASIRLAPSAKAAGLSVREYAERKRRNVVELPTALVEMRKRNERGKCACGCDADIDTRQLVGIVPEGPLFFRLGCR